MLTFRSITNRIRKRTYIIIAFTQKYFRVSYPQKNVSILLSKARIRPRTLYYRRGKRLRDFLRPRIKGKIALYPQKKGKIALTSCSLRATSFPWIRPRALVIKATAIYPNMEDFHGTNRAVTTYRLPMGLYHKQQVGSGLATMSTPSSTNSQGDQEHPFLSGVLLDPEASTKLADY